MDKRKILKYFLFYIFTIFSSVLAVILYIKFYPIESKVITESINKTIVNETGIEESIKNVYDAVVTVTSYIDDTKVGTGSGFIYKKDDNKGYVLTNCHVIDDSNRFEIILSNGETVEAKLLGKDEYSDIAVLSIDKDKVTKVATLGDNDLIEVGNTVFTVGSPMGEEYSGSVTRGIISSITRGIISGKDRMMENNSILTKVIQTDAAINPGNSGGPLVNLAGEVIGITSMKLASSQIEGMGFAIPINDVKEYVKYLEEGKEISRPALGVSLINASDRYKLYYYRINVDTSIEEGAVIAKIQNGGPADKAGLEVGDVIVKIDDYKIENYSRLRYYLYKYKINDKIKVTYIRGSKEHTIEVTLSE